MSNSKLHLLLLTSAGVASALTAGLHFADVEARITSLERWRPTVDTRLDRMERYRPDVTTSPNAEDGDMLLSVSIKNKRFDRAGAEDNRPWRQVDSIWWDATYEAFGLKKDARSIQGLLQFCDLFGDPKFEVRVNINDPVRARGRHRGPSTGIDFDRRNKSHEWLASTKLQNMTFNFRVVRVLYQDGSREEFGP